MSKDWLVLACKGLTCREAEFARKGSALPSLYPRAPPHFASTPCALPRGSGRLPRGPELDGNGWQWMAMDGKTTPHICTFCAHFPTKGAGASTPSLASILCVFGAARAFCTFYLERRQGSQQVSLARDPLDLCSSVLRGGELTSPPWICLVIFLWRSAATQHTQHTNTQHTTHNTHNAHHTVPYIPTYSFLTPERR